MNAEDSGSEQGSPVSRSGSQYSGSGSPGSPAGSDASGSGSPTSHRSRSGSRSSSGSHSGSLSHSRSASPEGSGSDRSRSVSPAASGSARSRSPSGSRSPSPAHSGSGRSRSHSGSRSPSPAGSGSVRSRSHSGSRSPSPGRSGSASPAGSADSRSVRSGSESPAHSAKSGSHHSSRRSSLAGSARGSPSSARSQSRSPHGSPGGSESDEVGRKKGVNVAEGSGSDEDDDVKATTDDIFGDADDISSDSGDDAAKEHSPADRNAEPVIQDDDDQEQPQEQPEILVEATIPHIRPNLGKYQHFVRLPNFISMETRPFDPALYEDEIDEDDVMDEEGRTRLKLKVENTIRWRCIKDQDGNDMKDDFGEAVRESNARIIRWSDGSMSLYLGKEIFDIHTMNLQGDHNHLFIRQGTSLQGQTIFKTKLTFRPHSTDSLTHRKMTLSMAERSAKMQKVKVLPIYGKDPDAHRSEMIKKEEERLRASIRRESQQRRLRERAHHRGLSTNYLEGDYEEEDEDENAISLSAIKNKYKPGNKKAGQINIYSSDSDEDSFTDDEKPRKKSLKARKLESDEESASDSGSAPKKPRLVSSSDEEGSRAGSAAGSASAHSDSD